MKKNALRVGLAALFAAWLPAAVHAAPPKEVRLDYAYYAPTSLVLKQQGLLQRTRSQDDARVSFVELTETGHELMRRYILDGITRFQMPLPDR